MICLEGKFQRNFLFPSDPVVAHRYLSDLSNILQYLPHSEVLEVYSPHRVRIQYQSLELGAYVVKVICDLECHSNGDDLGIIVKPAEGLEAPSSNATLRETTGYGYYSSHAKLYPKDGGTGIDYDFKFEARLLRPRGLRMMPRRAVERIATDISRGRVAEMAEGFITAAAAAFPDWQARQNGYSSKSNYLPAVSSAD